MKTETFYDQEELELLDEIGAGKWQNSEMLEQEKEEYKQSK